jgi:hypothetical protein
MILAKEAHLVVLKESSSGFRLSRWTTLSLLSGSKKTYASDEGWVGASVSGDTITGTVGEDGNEPDLRYDMPSTCYSSKQVTMSTGP